MDKINYELVEELSGDVDILKQLIITSSALSAFNALSKTIPNKNVLINTLGIQESKNSSEIENIYTTNTDIFESMILSEKTSNAKEVINYSKAVKCARDYIKDRPITLALLEEIQAIVETNKKGIRKIQVYIGNSKTKEVVHMPPEAQEINDLLDDLIKFVNIDFETNDNINSLVNIIVTHHQFESIHPFVDGNGRTGRILIITQLLDYGYLEEPILYVSRYINKTKAEYYKHLQAIRDDSSYEEWKEFILYYLKAMGEVAASSEQLILEIEKAINYTKDRLLTIKFRRNSDIRLIDLMFSHPFFTSKQYIETMDLKKMTALRDIDILVENSILEKISKGKNTYYKNIILYELLENIN